MHTQLSSYKYRTHTHSHAHTHTHTHTETSTRGTKLQDTLRLWLMGHSFKKYRTHTHSPQCNFWLNAMMYEETTKGTGQWISSYELFVSERLCYNKKCLVELHLFTVIICRDNLWDTYALKTHSNSTPIWQPQTQVPQHLDIHTPASSRQCRTETHKHPKLRTQTHTHTQKKNHLSEL